MRPYLNFSPKPFARRDPLALVFILVNSTMLAAVLFSVLYLLKVKSDNQLQSGEFDRLEMKKELLTDHFDHLNKELRTMDLRAYDKEVRFYAAIQQEMNLPWVDLLDTLGSILPEGVRLQQLSSEDGISEGTGYGQAVRLLAHARTKADEMTFLEQLQQMPVFTHVLIKSETYEQTSIIFEVGFQYQIEGGKLEHENP